MDPAGQMLHDLKQEYQSRKKFKAPKIVPEPVTPDPPQTTNPPPPQNNTAPKQPTTPTREIKFPEREIKTQDPELAKKGRDEAVIEAMRDEARIENKNYVLEGQQEAIKEKIVKEQEDKAKLDGLVKNAQDPLVTVSTVFPFTLFPTTISVEPSKVNIITKEFFGSEGIHCIYIKDVSDVIVQTNPFFGTIHIVDIAFKENSVEIEWLKKEDAFRLRRIIQGLVIANKHDIDVSKLDSAEMHKKIEELGKTHEMSSS